MLGAYTVVASSLFTVPFWQSIPVGHFLYFYYYVLLLLHTSPLTVTHHALYSYAHNYTHTNTHTLDSSYCYRSSTFHDSGKKVSIQYSQGQFTGYTGYDEVLLGSLTLRNVSVAVIETSVNFFSASTNWQGILGLGYDSLLKVCVCVCGVCVCVVCV